MRLTGKFVIAAAAAALAVGGATTSAIAANKPPTPLQIASSYMTAPTTINQRIPLKVKPPTGKKIAFMQSGFPQQVAVAKYFEQAMAAAGWSVTQIPWSSANAASVQSGLSNALLQGMQYVAAPGLDPRLISDSVRQQFLNAKVPIVVGQSCSIGYKLTPPVFPGTVMCANVVTPAHALAAWITADSGGKGSVMIANVRQFESFAFWADSLVSELAKMCPGCTSKILEIPYATFLANQSPSTVVNALRANPTFTYLMYDNGGFSRGILPALDAAGLLSKMKIGGMSMDEASRQAMVNGQEHVWVAQGNGNLGYAFADAVFRLATNSSGITQDAALIPQLVTNVNVGSIPNPYDVVPANSFAQFTKLWKLS